MVVFGFEHSEALRVLAAAQDDDVSVLSGHLVVPPAVEAWVSRRWWVAGPKRLEDGCGQGDRVALDGVHRWQGARQRYERVKRVEGLVKREDHLTGATPLRTSAKRRVVGDEPVGGPGQKRGQDLQVGARVVVENGRELTLPGRIHVQRDLVQDVVLVQLSPAALTAPGFRPEQVRSGAVAEHHRVVKPPCQAKKLRGLGPVTVAVYTVFLGGDEYVAVDEQ